MDILSWSFEFLWKNFFSFMNYELDFGFVTFTLFEFLYGSIIVFGIVAIIIRRLLK